MNLVLEKMFDWKTYILTALAVISFSSFVAVLFGHTIPNTIMTFFKVARLVPLMAVL